MKTKRVRVALALAVMIVGALLGPITDSKAAEGYPVPANGILTFEGRGWGHGRGMSQWGAQGAAIAGLGYAQILKFYYQGSDLMTRAPRDIGVRITAEDNDLQVQSVAGLVATDVASGASVDTGTLGATKVRVTAAGDGSLRLQSLGASGTWADVVAPTWPTTGVVGPIQFAGPSPIWTYQPTVERQYRGAMLAQASGTTGLRVINRLPMEDYLRSVVPSEAISSWRADALKAQAVAARSFASFGCQAGVGYDVLDTTACQVYRGMATRSGGAVTLVETASTNDAVATTAGQVVTLSGVTQQTQFSSSNGGWTVASGPWPAKADPYDATAGNSRNRWTGVNVSAATFARAYPSIGTLRQLDVLSRDGNGEWGGRVLSARLVGSSGSVTITGDQLASAGGLFSSWWHPVIWNTASTRVLALTLTPTGAQQQPIAASPTGSVTGPSQSLPLAEDPADWRHFLSREGDLVGLKVAHTESGRVEVHVLSAVSGFTQWTNHVATPLPSTATGLWAVGSFDGSGRPDLWFLPLSGTGTGGVEVHVLSAASNYQTWVLHSGTALGAYAPSRISLLVGDSAGRGDLTLVLREDTGSGMTEVHRLTRSSSYQAFDLHTRTPLGYSASDAFQFGLGTIDGDTSPDLLVILRSATGSGKVEVHSLSGASGMTAWNLHSATTIPAPSVATFPVRQP